MSSNCTGVFMDARMATGSAIFSAVQDHFDVAEEGLAFKRVCSVASTASGDAGFSRFVSEEELEQTVEGRWTHLAEHKVSCQDSDEVFSEGSPADTEETDASEQEVTFFSSSQSLRLAKFKSAYKNKYGQDMDLDLAGTRAWDSFDRLRHFSTLDGQVGTPFDETPSWGQIRQDFMELFVRAMSSVCR